MEAQDITLILMNKGGYQLSDGSGECVAVVGMKDCLNEKGQINSSENSAGGWNACAMRAYLNSDFKSSIPTTLLSIFKTVNVVAANGAGDTAVTSQDVFALPAEKEVFGGNIYGSAVAEATLERFEYYETAENRKKKVNDNYDHYLLRTPGKVDSEDWCYVVNNGTIGIVPVNSTMGISAFGCI